MIWKERVFTATALLLASSGWLAVDGADRTFPYRVQGQQISRLPDPASSDDERFTLLDGENLWRAWTEGPVRFANETSRFPHEFGSVANGWPGQSAPRDPSLLSNRRTGSYQRVSFTASETPLRGVVGDDLVPIALANLVPIALADPEGADEPPFSAPPLMSGQPGLVMRFGWWSTDTKGDLNKVGEYQDLGDAAFWDVDGLSSDGVRTIDLFATGLGGDGMQGGLDYFGPEISAGIDFQHYLHRLDHDPLTNFGEVHSGEEFIREDVNAGEDYAIRVSEMKTHFKGRLNKNIKYRLNVWGIRKQGERQAKALSHCFRRTADIPNRPCHVLSQRQAIDWVTLKVEPVVEARYGGVTVEYSRPMRIFSQSDQVVTRDYANSHGDLLYGVLPYAQVPDNVTQFDRLKVGIDLTTDTRFYANMKIGETRNKFRDTHRRYDGLDLRLTNRSWDGLTLTGYVKRNTQKNDWLPFRLDSEPTETSVYAPAQIRHPVDYLTARAGAEASWDSAYLGNSLRYLSLTGGWELGEIDRSYSIQYLYNTTDPDTPALLTPVDQEHTIYALFRAGATLRWSPTLNSYVRYRKRIVDDPLFGVREVNGDMNTGLPTLEEQVKIGGTWIPTSNFLASVSVGINNRRNRSPVADFDEDDFPITCTLWYVPTPAWRFSGGYAFYSNWIDQDITIPGEISDNPAETRRFRYGGRGEVLNLGAAYTRGDLTLAGGGEYVWSRNAFAPFQPWPDLAGYSDVAVERMRVTASVDWQWYGTTSIYFRYRYEDYQDRSVDYGSGTAHMVLAGLSAIY